MTESRIEKIAEQLSSNAARFERLRASGQAVKPQAVSLELSRRCIAKCVMCNIWKTPASQLALENIDWVELLADDFFSELVELDLTGGEPFLRKDLAELVCGAARLKNLAKLRSIAITTNGYLTKAILEAAPVILDCLKERGLQLVMVVALDAIGEVHDQIRNLPGTFANLDRTIAGLMELRQNDPNLIIGIKTTVLPMNVDQLDAIAAYAKKRGLFTIISPRIITGGRYMNDEKKGQFEFSDEQKEQMARFFEKDGSMWNFHGHMLAEYLRTGKVQKPCTCGFNYLFIRSNGDVYPCPLIDMPVGNVRDKGVGGAYFSPRAADWRRKIGRFAECSVCTEPGLERYSLPFEGAEYLRLLRESNPKSFLEGHRQIGLDKYL